MSSRLQRNIRGPGTHGAAKCYGAAGPFLVSQTYHGRGLRVGPHEHSAASLNFVVQGAYGETFRTRAETHAPDTVLYKPAGAMHANRFDRSDARCLLIEIEEEALASMLPRKARRNPLVSRDPRRAVWAARVLLEIQEWDDTSAMVVEELSIALFRSMSGETTTENGGKERTAEELLRETYRQPWSLRRVARTVGLHPAHLGRSFRARYGCTVGEFVRHLRVLQVVRELRNSEKPIANIALDAGFADQSHCTRVFRKLLAESPARFRSRCRCPRASPSVR